MDNAGLPAFLNSRLFWDVDLAKLDLRIRSNFIIERVFERGDVEDIRQCRRFYGDKKVSDALLNAKFLSLPTAYLAAAVINRPLFDFRCYNYARLNPAHWSY